MVAFVVSCHCFSCRVVESSSCSGNFLFEIFVGHLLVVCLCPDIALLLLPASLAMLVCRFDCLTRQPLSRVIHCTVLPMYVLQPPEKLYE
jgi:hypothetical protein